MHIYWCKSWYLPVFFSWCHWRWSYVSKLCWKNSKLVIIPQPVCPLLAFRDSLKNECTMKDAPVEDVKDMFGSTGMLII